MANLISYADGSFTGATTFATVDSTALVTTSATVTALSTSNLDSANFQPGAITVDGVAVKISSRGIGAGANTMSITLRNTTAGSDVKTVVINVSDLPVSTVALANGGWIFCKFDAATLLLAATNYCIRAVLSSTSTTVGLHTNGTANNWQHMLRTTTPATPTTGDDTFILGEWSAATNPATLEARVVTMDNEATTQFGANANYNSNTPSLFIGKGGTLNYAYAGGKNYYLKLAGMLLVSSGGTLTIGTVANPIPRNSTAVLELVTAANKLYAVSAQTGSTFTAQGLSRTSGKNTWKAMLTANASNPDTDLTVDTDTGWLSGDEIGIAATSRTQADCEVRVLNGDAGASTLNLTAPVSATHMGSAATFQQAEIILLTRNVKIRCTNTAYPGVLGTGDALVDMDWVQFSSIAGSFNPDSAGSAQELHYCSFYNASGAAAVPITTAGASWGNFTMEYIGLYTAITSNLLVTPATTASNWTIRNVIAMAGINGGTPISMVDCAGTWDYITVVGGSGGLSIADSLTAGWTTASTPHLVCHSSGSGVTLAGRLLNVTIASILSYNNGTGGVYFSANSGADYWNNVTIQMLRSFGNATVNLVLAAANYHKVHVDGGFLAGTTSFASARGISFTLCTVGSEYDFTFDDFNIGTASGILAAHTTADMDLLSSVIHGRLLFRNSLFDVTKVIGTSAVMDGFVIISARHNQTSGGSHLYWSPTRGLISPDNTTFKTAAPSEKLTPSGASLKLESSLKLIALNTAEGCTVTVWVRKSVAYSGAQPRLVQKEDPSVGNTADAVLDTMSVGADEWEQLSGSVAALTDNAAATLVVDCDGTTGLVYVDDWAVS